MITPFVAYYTLKYATNVAVDVALVKTKNILWYAITYPFSSRTSSSECIKCNCENCKTNYQDYQLL